MEDLLGIDIVTPSSPSPNVPEPSYGDDWEDQTSAPASQFSPSTNSSHFNPPSTTTSHFNSDDDPFSSSTVSASPQQPSSFSPVLTSDVLERKRTELIEEQRGNILRQYEAQQRASLEEKVKLSNEKHREILAQARTEVDKFYQDRKQRIAKAAHANREREPESSSKHVELSKEEAWQLLPKLVELGAAKTEGRDISRMRQVLLAAIPNARSK